MASLDIKLWGVRGSFPAPLSPLLLEKRVRDAFAGFSEKHPEASPVDIQSYLNNLPRHRLSGYGGNTTCVEITSERGRIIIDGGSGIRPLGYELMAGPCGKGQGEVHLLFTHVHWDHIIGLLFFTPIFIPGNRIHVYSVDADLRQVFETLFKKPFFPVPLSQLGSIIDYHRLEPRKTVEIQGIQVTPYRLDHPDSCWGYKFQKNGKTYSHCVDTECKRVTREELGEDLPLYQGVDLMLFDAQYTLMETIERVNWGHAAASLGLDIAMREGIGKVIFMHHDPASSDEKVAAAEAQARRYYNNQLNSRKRDSDAALSEVEWSFAHEGMHLVL